MKPSVNGRIVGQKLSVLLDVTRCVRFHTLLHVVKSCQCAKFETVQTLSYVQTDGTTPNIVGQQCWELLRPFASSFKRPLTLRVREHWLW